MQDRGAPAFSLLSSLIAHLSSCFPACIKTQEGLMNYAQVQWNMRANTSNPHKGTEVLREQSQTFLVGEFQISANQKWGCWKMGGASHNYLKDSAIPKNRGDKRQAVEMASPRVVCYQDPGICGKMPLLACIPVRHGFWSVERFLLTFFFYRAIVRCNINVASKFIIFMS